MRYLFSLVLIVFLSNFLTAQSRVEWPANQAINNIIDINLLPPPNLSDLEYKVYSVCHTSHRADTLVREWTLMDESGEPIGQHAQLIHVQEGIPAGFTAQPFLVGYNPVESFSRNPDSLIVHCPPDVTVECSNWNFWQSHLLIQVSEFETEPFVPYYSYSPSTTGVNPVTFEYASYGYFEDGVWVPTGERIVYCTQLVTVENYIVPMAGCEDMSQPGENIFCITLNQDGRYPIVATDFDHIIPSDGCGHVKVCSPPPGWEGSECTESALDTIWLDDTNIGSSWLMQFDTYFIDDDRYCFGRFRARDYLNPDSIWVADPYRVVSCSESVENTTATGFYGPIELRHDTISEKNDWGFGVDSITTIREDYCQTDTLSTNVVVVIPAQFEVSFSVDTIAYGCDIDPAAFSPEIQSHWVPVLSDLGCENLSESDFSIWWEELLEYNDCGWINTITYFVLNEASVNIPSYNGAPHLQICEQKITGIYGTAILSWPNDYASDCNEPEFFTPDLTGQPSAAWFGCEGSFGFDYSDLVEYSCSNSFTIQRSWTATNNCTGDSSMYLQQIFVSDLESPGIVAGCKAGDYQVMVNDGQAIITGPTPVGIDNCDPNPLVEAILEHPSGEMTVFSGEIVVDENGEYSLFVTATDACGNVDSCIVLIFVDGIIITGTEETRVMEDMLLSIYPNPATEQFNVSFNTTESGELTIALYNASGQLVRRIAQNYHVGSNTVTIQRNKLPAGIYMLQLFDGNNTYIQKVILQ